MRSVLELGDGALQPAPRPAARRRGVDEAPPQLAEPRRASSVAIEAQASRLGRSKQSRLRLFPDRGDSSSMMQFQVTGEWTNSCLELHPPFRWRCRSRSQSRTEGCSRLPTRTGKAVANSSSSVCFCRVACLFISVIPVWLHLDFSEKCLLLGNHMRIAQEGRARQHEQLRAGATRWTELM